MKSLLLFSDSVSKLPTNNNDNGRPTHFADPVVRIYSIII